MTDWHALPLTGRIRHDCCVLCRPDERVHCDLVYADEADPEVLLAGIAADPHLYVPLRLVPAVEAPPAPAEPGDRWQRFGPGPDKPLPHAFLLWWTSRPGVAIAPHGSDHDHPLV